jgi:hypothetical protein
VCEFKYLENSGSPDGERDLAIIRQIPYENRNFQTLWQNNAYEYNVFNQINVFH